MSDLVMMARAVAMTAHAGQVDLAGDPYIQHPWRVAKTIGAWFPEDEELIAAAWLHDVVEDTQLTISDLSSMGFPFRTLRAVDAVTKRKGESYEDAVRRAAGIADGRYLKLADIEDNTREWRLEKLDIDKRIELRLKYERAREILVAGMG